MNRLAVGGLAAALLASSLAVTQSAHAGTAGPGDAPVAFGGAVNDLASLALTDVTVLVEPRAETVAALEVGDRMPMYVLPKDVVRFTGSRYTVAVDPEDIPDENVSDDGLVTFRIDMLSAGGALFGSAVTSVRAYTAPGAAGPVWVDPLEYLGERDGSVPNPDPGSAPDTAPPSGPATENLTPDDETGPADLVAPVNGLPMNVNVSMVDSTGYLNEAGACEEGECSPENLVDVPDGPDVNFFVGNPYCTLLRTSDRWSTVGTSYPRGGHQSWLNYTSSTSTSMGAAISSDNTYGSFSTNGTKTTADSWGQNFAAADYDRSYRIETRMGNYRCTSYWTMFTWSAIQQNGYTWSYPLSTKPNWNQYCGPIAPGKWWRGQQRGSDYSLSYGIKIKDLIGIDLSTRRAYSSGSRLVYDAPVARTLCGNNGEAGVASKMRERAL